jgi:predicted dehydrogenase
MKLRGAISGFGEVAAKAHLPGWTTRSEIAIAAIHDPVPERRNQAIRLAPGARVYDDLALMLDGESPDFVDIASPPALHAGAARAALEAGAHVLVEKPLCLVMDEFDSLVRLARERDRVLMCVHNWKYAPAYALARRMIDEGRLGAVTFVSLDRLRTEPAGAGRAGGAWRSGAESGGGILIDHGWHVFYLMRWLMGGAAPHSISASLSAPSAAAAEELADLRVAFGGGRIARAHLSWRAPTRRTSALVYGEAGMLEIEGDRVRLTSRSGSSEDIPVADLPDDSYHSAWFAAMAAEFERGIAEGSAGPTATINLAEAQSALALVIAGRKSAKMRGIAVEISL